MKQYEKLALALITLVVAGHVFAFARDLYIAQTYGAAGLPPVLQKQWAIASVVLARLVDVGVGVWLFIEARREKLAAWVWGLFGLVFGLIGLVVFYLLLSYRQLAGNHGQET